MKIYWICLYCVFENLTCMSQCPSYWICCFELYVSCFVMSCFHVPVCSFYLNKRIFCNPKLVFLPTCISEVLSEKALNSGEFWHRNRKRKIQAYSPIESFPLLHKSLFKYKGMELVLYFLIEWPDFYITWYSCIIKVLESWEMTRKNNNKINKNKENPANIISFSQVKYILFGLIKGTRLKWRA